MSTDGRHCPNCDLEIPSMMAFCRSCWARLPGDTRKGINSSWRAFVNWPRGLDGKPRAVRMHQERIAEAAAWLRERG
ncbi:MAG: hypothetical protein ACREN7_00095 [Candidatus Dormibacteria bacterium]